MNVYTIFVFHAVTCHNNAIETFVLINALCVTSCMSLKCDIYIKQSASDYDNSNKNKLHIMLNDVKCKKN